jgi:starch synthase (maltosyl-transferring)
MSDRLTRTSSAASPVPSIAAGGTSRVVVEQPRPAVDGGRFPIKRTIGESVSVTADMFADGHDLIAGVLKYRWVARQQAADPPPAEPATHHPEYGGPAAAAGGAPADRAMWSEVPLAPLGNDRWTATFTVTELGTYVYTVEGWIDRFGTWLKGLIAKHEAGQDVASELLEGAQLAEAAVRLKPDATCAEAGFSRPEANDRLLQIADDLRSDRPQAERVAAARDTEFRALMEARPDRSAATTFEPALPVTVDPVRARFGAWYEMFPRSYTPDPTRSATFREAEARLPDIEAMGFDVLYLPPIHPIGRTHRKGRNNSLTSEPEDVGSPWAIGSAEGGHTAVEPGLGTLADFDRFVQTAGRLGLEIALDIAFQASPDHPWVREHPEWFRHRPDGSIKYAENPPKKYQDIYPIDFESRDWFGLWQALRDVFLFWIGHGVKIFRVDNPHTKSFRFWEWCIADIKRGHPDAIFLSEAFTRPKLMQYLAKSGFTQSYTYFTWRNSAAELREYLIELTQTDVREYLRPNFFANTPDILNEYLQRGGRPAFEVRLVLAATLAASYGIYSGFELSENVPVRPGSEEYLDSEKYQIKIRDWNQAGSLRELIARVNDIRREHPALQQNDTLQFHASDNDALLWYSKSFGDDRVFVVANTTPDWMQHGWLEMPIAELGIPPDTPYIVEDLLDEAKYTWHGSRNYVRLDPAERMAHIFVVRR